MRLTTADVIAGWPAMVVRDALRFLKDRDWSITALAGRLPPTPLTAVATLERLLHAGLVEPSNHQEGREYYRVSEAGRALTLAKLTKPITRQTANRALSELIERAESVNLHPHYVYRVAHVVVFGSFLSDVARLGDVDVAVRLERKYGDGEAQRSAEAQRVQDAYAAGRRFNNLIDQLYWPQREVLLFLKSRSRAISLHDPDDAVLQRCEWKQVYP